MTSRSFIAILLLPPLFVLAPAAAAQSSWTDSIKLSGDTRIRYESIDAEGSDKRDRSRFRARFGLEARPADDLKLVFRFATGDGSPVSTNLTMDDGFSAKQILVDRAYVDWRVNDLWNVRVGKMKNPWFRAGGTPLVWDSDLNPEGVAALFKSENYFGSISVMSVEERSAADDSLLFSVQGGWTGNLRNEGTLTAGMSLYNYGDTRGNAPFYDGDANGNSIDGTGNYVSDYQLIELFAEYKTVLNDLPLTVYADTVQNIGADTSQDMAYTIGATIGKASARGAAQVGYAWLDTEADAVVGTFNDSDFAGGETDSSGHLIQAKYAVRDNVTLGGTLIIAERAESLGSGSDYNRLMLDIAFSFE
ncbi:MAG: hypothetical protein HKN35_14000 [Woeseia sp.]|nr:putative porin [Woeseia sp.]MBT8096521.1 putative porin [Woeseia sp.]NNE62002.1 hypothetical protein [Woeseia sp.]NNL55008.1 hypothetical protein [Woeseia sp.]